MKIVVFSMLLSSCGLVSTNQVSVADKMYRCVLELVGNHGVKAPQATKACQAVYGRE